MTGNVTILLVEDDLDDQDFFIEAVSQIENASMFGIAKNGQEAISRLQRGGYPEIIFMDINMPKMNGVDCLKAIYTNPITQHIPVVILSTSTGQTDLAHYIGAKGLMVKPNSVERLRHQITNMIELVIRSPSIDYHLL